MKSLKNFRMAVGSLFLFHEKFSINPSEFFVWNILIKARERERENIFPSNRQNVCFSFSLSFDFIYLFGQKKCLIFLSINSSFFLFFGWWLTFMLCLNIATQWWLLATIRWFLIVVAHRLIGHRHVISFWYTGCLSENFVILFLQKEFFNFLFIFLDSFFFKTCHHHPTNLSFKFNFKFFFFKKDKLNFYLSENEI